MDDGYHDKNQMEDDRSNFEKGGQLLIQSGKTLHFSSMELLEIKYFFLWVLILKK